MQICQNNVFEIELRSEKNHFFQPDRLVVNACFTAPDNKKISVSGFWAGENKWKIRYSSDVIGTHTFVTQCSEDESLSGMSGDVEIVSYAGENPLYVHGSIDKKTNSRYLTHKDGTPFFWLGDTWWMGFCDRISFPDEFGELIADRKKKGFSVAQIIAGLYPDMDWYDPRGMNEGGYPWSKDFAEINPKYFDYAEKKLKMLIENGITPCIVGSWGFFMGIAGKENIKRHWQYLISRFGAYPVAWCACGEANMPFYDANIDQDTYFKQSRTDWNDILEFIISANPFNRMVTIHPTQYGHEQIDNPDLLDLDMLQTGHGGYPSLLPTMSAVKKAVGLNKFPVINSEVCYEGICGSSYSDVQRYAFLSCFFLGAAGHTYGANGMWQLNGINKSYGPSPHGAEWGKTSWRDAANLPGSGQIGAFKLYLEKFDWQKFEFHPEWVQDGCDGSEIKGHFAAGYDNKVIMIYKPNFGGDFWGDIYVKGMFPGKKYVFERFDMVNNQVEEMGEIIADDEGKFKCPRVKIFGDWIYSFVLVE